MAQGKGMHYGWYVVMSSFFIMISYAILTSLHSLFMKPVMEALGMTATEFSFVFFIGGLGVTIGSSFMGKLLVKGNMKLIMAGAVIISGLGFMAYSQGTSPLYFYIIAFIVGVSNAGFANIPISIMLTNWFYKKKGLAMSLAFAGAGIGAAAFSPVLTNIITNQGYQTAYIVAGALMITVALPFILLFVKKSPADKSMLAVGADESSTPAQQTNGQAAVAGLTLGQSKKTLMFWLFILGMVCIALVAGGVQMHIPAYLQSVGHSAMFAGTIVGILSLANTLGKLILGAILDKFGTAGGAIYTGIFMAIALISLLLAKAPTLAIVFAIAYGLSIVVASVGPPFMTGDIFGKKDFGAIFGFIQMFFVGGSSIGVLVSGFIYDATKSYNFAWLFFLALFTIGIISIIIANGMKKSVAAKFLNG